MDNNNYFYKLSNHLIDEETRSILISHATGKSDEFFAYKGQRTGKEDGNYIFVRGFLKEVEGVQRLIRACTVECYPLIMKQHANLKGPIHIDNPNGRNCVIITPLIPEKDFVSTNFYTSFEDTVPIVSVDYSDGLPALINTQRLHNLNNNDNLRMNFQLCFENSFNEIRNLLLANKLFVF